MPYGFEALQKEAYMYLIGMCMDQGQKFWHKQIKKGCGWNTGGSWVEHGWTTSGVHIHVDHIWKGGWNIQNGPPSSKFN